MNLKDIKKLAKRTAEIVKDEDSDVNISLAELETTGALNWDFKITDLARETLLILKEEGFDLFSRDGRTFLVALKERFAYPKRYGYNRDEVYELYKVFEEILGISIFTFYPIKRRG